VKSTIYDYRIIATAFCTNLHFFQIVLWRLHSESVVVP
jgi:hypothetical protein